MLPGALDAILFRNSSENLKQKLRCVRSGGVLDALDPTGRARGIRGSSVAARVMLTISGGGEFVADAVRDALRDGVRDFDFGLDEPPMMLRRKPRRPPSRSASESRSGEEGTDVCRLSSSGICECVVLSLDSGTAVGRGAVGVGGRMPLKARNEPPGATWVSVLTMSRRRPGAGLQGAVGCSSVCDCSASFLRKR